MPLVGADDARSNKVLLVMEYLEGGPVVLGEGRDGQSRMSEAIARKFFRDVVQVRRWLLLLQCSSSFVSLFPSFSRPAAWLSGMARLALLQGLILCDTTIA